MLPPDNVAVTLSIESHLASTCDATCLSYIEVDLAGIWSLYTICNESKNSYLSHDILRRNTIVAIYAFVCSTEQVVYSLLVQLDYTHINILKSGCNRVS